MAETGPADRAPRGRRVVAVVILGVALVATSILIGRATAPVKADPSDTSVEAGFARDMQVHHAQAVEMALLVRDLTDDPDLRLLAYDIATSQAQQSGQMYGWLEAWGLSQAGSEPSMTWMTRPVLGADSHDGMSSHEPGSTMPGLATQAQLDELASLRGVDAERLFLELMIAHHQGGVEMAQAALDRTTNRVVVDLATSIVRAQTSEITVMQDMLEALPEGGP